MAVNPADPTLKHLNIVLHGLFFMTLDPTTVNDLRPKLIIYVPRIPQDATQPVTHIFAGGLRDHVAELNGTIDWFPPDIGLIGNPPQWPKDPDGHFDKTQIPYDIKPPIFQFTANESSVGAFPIPNPILQGKISLPWPLAFYPLRCDDVDKAFPFVQPSKIGASIRKHCLQDRVNRLIGSSVCLRYAYQQLQINLPRSNDNMAFHFYHEPCDATLITPKEVNKHLADAANIFTNSQNFDLQMQDVPIPLPTTKPCAGPPVPPDPDPDHAIDNVKNAFCLCEDEIVHPQVCPDTDLMVMPGEGGSDPSMSPANCPVFYVGP